MRADAQVPMPPASGHSTPLIWGDSPCPMLSFSGTFHPGAQASLGPEEQGPTRAAHLGYEPCSEDRRAVRTDRRLRALVWLPMVPPCSPLSPHCSRSGFCSARPWYQAFLPIPKAAPWPSITRSMQASQAPVDGNKSWSPLPLSPALCISRGLQEHLSCV